MSGRDNDVERACRPCVRCFNLIALPICDRHLEPAFFWGPQPNHSRARDLPTLTKIEEKKVLYVFWRLACCCGARVRVPIIICYLLRLEERLTISKSINVRRSLAYTIIIGTVICWRSACLPVGRDDDHKMEGVIKRRAFPIRSKRKPSEHMRTLLHDPSPSL